MQCRGTTKKGQRCRIQSPTEYCRYHSPAARAPARPARPAPKSTAPAPPKPGYVYVYTLKVPQEAQWYDGKAGKYRELKAPFWKRLFKPTKMLVKVGYTSHNPLDRMAQWEAQCSHKIKPVAPKRSKLYDQSKHGWHSQSAHRDEQAIHAILRRQYGTGKVHCQGCASNDKMGVHIEWFLLPNSKSVKQVFKVIESCLSYS